MRVRSFIVALLILAAGSVALHAEASSYRDETSGTIPPQWIDVPGAPLVAEVHTKDGQPYAVLVNRSDATVVSFEVGGVENEAGRTRVRCEIMTHTDDGGGVGPGSLWGWALPMARGKAHVMIAKQNGCAETARHGVVRATFADGTTWTAEGAPWRAGRE
jgi:hypothetical protein